MSTKPVQSDLIYDLGMHIALDTEFYLNKGFRVVALEANPRLVAQAQTKLAGAMREERLKIVERAIWTGDQSEVSFFVNDKKDDWSSVLEGNANRDGTGVSEIRVKTTNLRAMFEEYGLPYYLKCDIEGADEVVVEQLVAQDWRPSFASFEVSEMRGAQMIAKLFAAGYDRMQIVNQGFNAFTKAPNPALEGNYVDARFNGHMSGLFGRELPPNRWTSFEKLTKNYLDFFDLKSRDETLANGWVDVHLTTSSVLGY